MILRRSMKHIAHYNPLYTSTLKGLLEFDEENAKFLLINSNPYLKGLLMLLCLYVAHIYIFFAIAVSILRKRKVGATFHTRPFH